MREHEEVEEELEHAYNVRTRHPHYFAPNARQTKKPQQPEPLQSIDCRGRHAGHTRAPDDDLIEWERRYQVGLEPGMEVVARDSFAIINLLSHLEELRVRLDAQNINHKDDIDQHEDGDVANEASLVEDEEERHSHTGVDG